MAKARWVQCMYVPHACTQQWYTHTLAVINPAMHLVCHPRFPVAVALLLATLLKVMAGRAVAVTLLLAVVLKVMVGRIEGEILIPMAAVVLMLIVVGGRMEGVVVSPVTGISWTSSFVDGSENAGLKLNRHSKMPILDNHDQASKPK